MGPPGRKCTLLLAAAALVLLLAQVPAAQARTNRATIACSMYVDPCHCGLCPRIVDCSKQPTAECFCGTASPGIYPNPNDPSKFWMCSYDTQTHIPYGVEVPCPARLVFDPVVKVCTVPAAVSPAPTKDVPVASATPPPARAAKASIPVQPSDAKPADNNKPNSSSSSSKSTTANSQGSATSQGLARGGSSQVPSNKPVSTTQTEEGAAYRLPATAAAAAAPAGTLKANDKRKP